ncbi:hypothetical protein C8Q74DRAFT_1444068 [Fomes fomentarius]|nr:hypothetical protein C8Q74DRAFT_1444068 [Fomes fomentarius]
MLVIEAGKSYDVVCNLACGRQAFEVLQEESKVYDKLRPLMPDYVPNVLSFYTGETYEGRTSVLVMQDAGEELRVPLRQQPLKFRQSTLEGILAVHRAGVSHQDFRQQHVVVTQLENGEYWPLPSASRRPILSTSAVIATRSYVSYRGLKIPTVGINSPEDIYERRLR